MTTDFIFGMLMQKLLMISIYSGICLASEVEIVAESKFPLVLYLNGCRFLVAILQIGVHVFYLHKIQKI